MDELRLTGNCLKGSRPLLSFDASFSSQPELKLLKELFVQVRPAWFDDLMTYNIIFLDVCSSSEPPQVKAVCRSRSVTVVPGQSYLAP